MQHNIYLMRYTVDIDYCALLSTISQRSKVLPKMSRYCNAGKMQNIADFLSANVVFNQVSNLILSSDKIELFSIRKLSLTWNITASWTMIHHPCPIGFFTFVHRRPGGTFFVFVVNCGECYVQNSVYSVKCHVFIEFYPIYFFKKQFKVK